MHKKGGGFGGMFGKNASMLSSVASLGGYGRVAGQVSAAAVTTAAGMSGSIKAKDEMTLDMRAQAPGSESPALQKQFKAKAKSAGEDIITPLVEQVAQTIVDATKK